MCGRMRFMWPISEVIEWSAAERSRELRRTTEDSPADEQQCSGRPVQLSGSDATEIFPA